MGSHQVAQAGLRSSATSLLSLPSAEITDKSRHTHPFPPFLAPVFPTVGVRGSGFLTLHPQVPSANLNSPNLTACFVKFYTSDFAYLSWLIILVYFSLK